MTVCTKHLPLAGSSNTEPAKSTPVGGCKQFATPSTFTQVAVLH